MMYRKTTPRFQVTNADLRLQRRVLLIVCAVLLIATAVLGVLLFRSGNYQSRVEMQIDQRIYSASTAAIDEVGRLGSVVTSNAAGRLARVRQYIYYMEQLNNISISLAGGERGRLISAELFTSLYSDLDTFENQLAQSTTSTMDIRTHLQNHLQELQAVLLNR